MILKRRNFIFVVCMLFAVDSLIKLNLPGFRVHPGHLLIIFFFLYVVLSQYIFRNLNDFFHDNFFFSLYVIFSLCQVVQSNSLGGFIFVYTYVLLAFFLFFSLYCCRWVINYKLIFKSVVYLVVAGGFFQFSLYVLAGYQLALGGLDLSYYNKGTSVTDRMRGFFLEPNWFGVFLTLAFVGYSLTREKVFSRDILILLAVVVCSILSGNRLSTYFVIIICLVQVFRESNFTLTYISALFLGLFPVFYFVFSVFFANVGDWAVDDRSLAARTVTASLVFNYMYGDFNVSDWIVGRGLSNWSTVALHHGLTIKSSLLEDGLALRDTSESYVIVFEQGLLGCSLLLFDLVFFVYVAFQKSREQAVYALISASFLLCTAFYYPIYFFMMYLAPYFLIRVYFVVLWRRGNESSTSYKLG